MFGSLGTAKVVVDVEAKTGQAAAELGATKTAVGGLGRMLKGAALAGGLAAAGTAAVAFGKSIVNAASEAQQSIGGVEAVFGDTAGTVIERSKAAAEAMGLPATEYNQFATVLGKQLKTKGIDGFEDKTHDLIQIGADLAATYGGDTADAVGALGATMRGEFDSAERFGLALSANAVAAKAVELGLADSTSSVDDNAKAMATLALIQEQTADTAGQFARESDTLAGVSQRLSARWQNMQADLGQKLLPLVEKAVVWFADDLAPAISKVVAVVAKEWPKIWAVVKPVMESVQRLVGVVVEGIAKAWERWGPVITRIAGHVFDIIASYVKGFVKIISGLIDILTGIFTGDWKRVWEGVKKIFTGIWDIITGALRGVTGIFREVIGALRDVVSGAWSRAWDFAKSTFSNIWSTITESISELPGKLAGIAGSLYSKAKDWGSQIVSGIVSGLGGAGGAVWDFATKLGNALKSVINTNVIGKIKNFSFTLDLNPIPYKKTFQPFGALPYLAAGGIVTGPTLAVIGERGPEAVVPLDRYRSGGNTYNVVVNAGVGDPVEIGRAVVDAIRAYERSNGDGWRASA